MRSTFVRRLASPYLAIGFFVLAAFGALATAHKLQNATLMMSAPFVLLGINLGAAIMVKARFRADLPLLVFHLALLAIALLFVYSRLTYFDGYAVLTRGQVFEGEYERAEFGPLHGRKTPDLPFINVWFKDHNPDGSYPKVLNEVMWLDEGSGRWLNAEIQNDRPLLLNGYRIYPRRGIDGLSPLMSWTPVFGDPSQGYLPLPPAHRVEDFPKGVSWTLNPGRELWAMIQVRSELPPNLALENAGADQLDHVLVLREGDTRYELRPNTSIDFPEGRLTYLALDAWKGYRVVRDPAEPFLLGAIATAVSTLIWFYARRFRQLGRTN